MASHLQRNAAAKVEPDRIGKMHARRRREPSVRAQLARRLRGFRGRAGRVGAQLSRSRMQRVIVKTHVARHRPGKTKGSIARHVNYLGRDSASGDGKPGVFYDRSREGVDARQETAGWVPDRHHFRIIISPERGADIPDMTAYVRDVMGRIEKDLAASGVIEVGSRLQWIGINHHNTDNPHAHVVLRGKRVDGQDLVIPRAYLAHGMRQRASEAATELLGERTIEQDREARLKEVEAERFTSLDRMIERHVENRRIDLSPAKRIGFGADDRQLVLARLAFLEGIGLAHQERGTGWSLEEEFARSLRELGQRNDIIKQLYGQLGNEAGWVQRMTGGTEAPVAGIVIAKDQADELEDDRFVVIRDGAGQAHYGRVRDTPAYRNLRIGSVAEVGAGTQWRQRIAEQIVAIAQAGGVYSEPLHAAHLRTSRPDITDWEMGSAIRSAQSRLAFVAGFEASGVRATEDGTYAVEAEAFARFTQCQSDRTDVRVIAAHALERQIEARAATWLDRQAFGSHPDPRMADHPAVQEAIAQRKQWLARNGYVEQSAIDDTTIELRAGALEQLALAERTEVARRLAGNHGLPVAELPQRGAVSGQYAGVEHLHSGKWVVVVTEEKVYVSPVVRMPDVDTGTAIELQRSSAHDSMIELTAGRSRDLGQGLSLDGAGGDR